MYGSAKSGRRGQLHSSLTGSIEQLEERRLFAVAVAPTITGLSLLNTQTRAVISPLKEGAVLDLSKIGTNISVRAETQSGGSGSVIFTLDGKKFHVESAAPYEILGDTNGHTNPWTPTPGAHTLTVTPTSGLYGTGTVGKSLTVHFSVAAPPSSAFIAPVITRLALLNGQTNVEIAPLTEGATLDLNKLGRSLSVRADTQTVGSGSIVFTLDGAKFHVENAAPYDILGDNHGIANPWTPSAEKHTLTVTPYSAIGGTGIAGKSVTVHFSVAGMTTNATSISWRTLAPSPITRAEAVGLAVNGKLYVLGGFNGVLPGGHFIATPRCDVFDPVTNKWTRIADMPEPFTHGEGVVVGNSIWFAGIYTGNHPGPGSTHVWEYNTVTNKWSRGPDLPVARGAAASGIIGSKIYVVGGMDKTRTYDERDMWSYDLANPSKGWVKLPSMPSPRNHVTAAVLNGQLYVIGGQLHQEENQTALRVVERYDPATNKWTTVASLPAPRSHAMNGTFVMDGKIILVGGEDGFDKPHNTVFSYDPAANKWTTIGYLPANRSTVVAGAIGGQIIVATGNSPSGTATCWIGTLH